MKGHPLLCGSTAQRCRGKCGIVPIKEGFLLKDWVQGPILFPNPKQRNF